MSMQIKINNQIVTEIMKQNKRWLEYEVNTFTNLQRLRQTIEISNIWSWDSCLNEEKTRVAHTTWNKIKTEKRERSSNLQRGCGRNWKPNERMNMIHSQIHLINCYKNNYNYCYLFNEIKFIWIIHILDYVSARSHD